MFTLNILSSVRNNVRGLRDGSRTSVWGCERGQCPLLFWGLKMRISVHSLAAWIWFCSTYIGDFMAFLVVEPSQICQYYRQASLTVSNTWNWLIWLNNDNAMSCIFNRQGYKFASIANVKLYNSTSQRATSGVLRAMAPMAPKTPLLGLAKI